MSQNYYNVGTNCVQDSFSEELEEEGGNYGVHTMHIVEEKETRVALMGPNVHVKMWLSVSELVI